MSQVEAKWSDKEAWEWRGTTLTGLAPGSLSTHQDPLSAFSASLCDLKSWPLSSLLSPSCVQPTGGHVRDQKAIGETGRSISSPSSLPTRPFWQWLSSFIKGHGSWGNAPLRAAGTAGDGFQKGSSWRHRWRRSLLPELPDWRQTRGDSSSLVGFEICLKRTVPSSNSLQLLFPFENAV